MSISLCNNEKNPYKVCGFLPDVDSQADVNCIMENWLSLIDQGATLAQAMLAGLYSMSSHGINWYSDCLFLNLINC